MQTQELQCVVLVTLHDSQRRLQDITHGHLNMMWVLATMEYGFLSVSGSVQIDCVTRIIHSSL